MNTQGTPIALPLRIWLAVEVLFGIGAVLAVGISPAETKTNFAWTIQPVVMAAVLGAFYASSALLFLLPLFAKRWEMIRVMILPTTVFATVQLIATVLHWDKFSIGTTPFYVWFASYLLPPPIFVAAYVWHQRRAAKRSTGFTATSLASLDIHHLWQFFGDKCSYRFHLSKRPDSQLSLEVNATDSSFVMWLDNDPRRIDDRHGSRE